MFGGSGLVAFAAGLEGLGAAATECSEDAAGASDEAGGSVGFGEVVEGFVGFPSS